MQATQTTPPGRVPRVATTHGYTRPPTASPPHKYPKGETAVLKKFGDNVRSRREAQDLSSSPTLSLSNGQEQLAELDRIYGHNDSDYPLPE